MSHKSPRRPRQAAPKLISADELARRMGVDERTVRRWRRAGCPVAVRGKAGHRSPLFNKAAVDAWLAKHEGDERRMVSALIAVNDARAGRERNTFLRLQNQYVRPTDVTAQWQVLVSRVRHAAGEMVDGLARRLAARTDAPPSALEPQSDRRVLAADDLRAILSRDPASHPWRPAATPAIAAFAARDVGIELRDDGTWHELAAQWMIGMRAATPAYPITSAISSAVRACLLALSTMKSPASKPADPLPTVKASKTLRSARAQLAGCQAALVALRDAIANSTVTLRDGAEREGKTRAIAFRTRLLAMSRCAPALTRAAADVDEIRPTLRRHVDEVLAELEPRQSRKEATA